MDIASLLYGLGSGSIFASRAFLPAFLTSFFLRFGDKIPFMKEVSLFQNLSGEPCWFTHGGVITVLGVLAIIEIAATKFPEVEEGLGEVIKYGKAVVAVLTGLGFMSATDAQFVEEVVAPVVQEAGLMGTLVLPFIGLMVFSLASARVKIMEFLRDMDDDDVLGIRGVLSWAEDTWVLVGTIILIVYPLIMVACLGIVIAALFLIRKYLEHREEQSLIPCSKCQTEMHPCALQCPSCNAENPSPRSIGFFGQSLDYAAPDRDQHELDLAEKRRCPACGTRFKKKHPRQKCERCDHDLFAGPEFQNRYIERVAKRLPRVLFICTGLSFLPVVGFIPGIIYYRTRLASPFSCYMPVGKRCCLKWLLRILLLLLVSVQLIPVLGAVVIPLMAILSYLLYKGGFKTMSP